MPKPKVIVPVEALGIPEYSPVLWIWRDVASRMCKCRSCGEMILRNEPRVVGFMTMPYMRIYKNGGRSRQAKFFVHPQCLVSSELEQLSSKRFCRDCSRPITSDYRLVGISRYERVCLVCIETSKYRKCDVCLSYYTCHKVSPVISHPKWSGEWERVKFVCERCVDNDGFVTVRSKNKKERADKKFEDKYNKIVEDIEINGIFG